MKLIIDIPEDTYLLCKSLPMDDIQKAIANGAPYEEKPKYFPPCEDCNKKMGEIRQAYDKMKAMEKPQGEWIMIKNSDGNLKCYECSNCGKAQGYISNYCKDCGAEMEGGNK